MSGEILQGFSCEFIHEGDSCKLVDFLMDENRRLRAARDVWVENNAKLWELCKAWREFAYEIFDECFGEPELNEDFMALDDRMRELGVDE